MDDSTRKNLEILKRIMNREIKPILFTGAGFSYEAKNAYGEAIPLGKDLKERLILDLLHFDKESDDYRSFMAASLDKVYGYVKKSKESQAIGFLVDLFSHVKPEEHHKTIANFPWQKVYTVNIDDLYENSISNPALLNPINSPKPLFSSRKQRIDYIKLHGCVRNRDAGFIFSKDEYQQKITGKLDYRFTRLSEDLQVQDFVFIGTSGDEPDITSYLLKYGFDDSSRRGNIFVVDPYPDSFRRQDIKEAGAYLIEMTAREFAEWMKASVTVEESIRDAVFTQKFRKNFLDVGKYLEAHSKQTNYSSRFYFGDNPTWLDILTDYDFPTPSVKKAIKDIENLIASSNQNIIYCLLSKAIGGKSVHLKRIGFTLVKNGYDVYEYIGSEFHSEEFLNFIERSKDNVCVLLVDNAHGNYPQISRILNDMPFNKRIIIITTSRPYFHYKKYYELRHFPGYSYLNVDDLLNANYYAEVGSSAVKTLTKNGLISELKGYTNDEARIKLFVHDKDICESLWTIFKGSKLKDRFEDSVRRIFRLNSPQTDPIVGILVRNVMIALALFYQEALPHIPDSLLHSWLGEKKKTVLGRLIDVTKRVDDKGISLRTGIMTKSILSKASQEEKLTVLEIILKKIAPLIIGPRDSYYHQIQSRLMNESFLNNHLQIKSEKVRDFFSHLLPYYDEDANYFLQLGKTEQRLKEYDLALNHFKQAQSLAPNYYNVMNAIARNYLLQSHDDHRVDKETAAELYKTGHRLMLELIDEKEQYQVRAYSIHSLVIESVAYWWKWWITPSKDNVSDLLLILKEACEDFPDDKMMRHACREIKFYLDRKHLNHLIPADNEFNLLLASAALAKASDFNDSDYELID